MELLLVREEAGEAEHPIADPLAADMEVFVTPEAQLLVGPEVARSGCTQAAAVQDPHMGLEARSVMARSRTDLGP